MTDSEIMALRALFQEQTAETRRHMDVLAEHLTSQVRLVAEGHVLLAAKLDSVAAEVSGHTRQLEVVTTQIRVLSADVGDLKKGQASLQQELVEFRAEVVEEFKEVRAQIHLSYSELDQRLHSLEHEVVDLRGRVERLESRFQAS